MDANKMHREKSRWEQHKNARCCFEQIPGAKPNKTAGVQPLTSHLISHISKTNKTCKVLSFAFNLRSAKYVKRTIFY